MHEFDRSRLSPAIATVMLHCIMKVYDLKVSSSSMKLCYFFRMFAMSSEVLKSTLWDMCCLLVLKPPLINKPQEMCQQIKVHGCQEVNN